MESGEIDVSVSLPHTSVGWLNQLLLNTVFDLEQDEAVIEKTPEILIQQRQKRYDDFLEDGKEDGIFSVSHSLQSRYLGQRQHMVSFSFYQYKK